MTREEFDNLYSWGDLFTLCNDERCDILDDIYGVDTFHDWIDEQTVDWARNQSWRELYDTLSHYDDLDGYDYYVWDENDCEYRPVNDDDFDYYKDRICTFMVERGSFEDEDEESEDDSWDFADFGEYDEDVEPDGEEDDPVPSEDIPIELMFFVGIERVEEARKEELRFSMEQDEEFKELTNII